MSEHEGASTWTWDTIRKISKSMKVVLSRVITPNTTEMIDEAIAADSDIIDYVKLKKQVDAKVAQDTQCPCQHPVIPFELRLQMQSARVTMQVFPNMDGFPMPYLPVRFYLCGVCQEVYRQREVEIRKQEVA